MIKYKALVLLALFLLHTAVGLACAFVMPRQLTESPAETAPHHSNKTHSHSGPATTTHSPAAAAAHDHGTSKPASHHHSATDNHHSDESTAEACCQDEVSEIVALAKVVPQKVSFPVSPYFFAAVLTYFYQADVFVANTLSPREKYFARSYHPPIPRIRLAIQSFLI